MWRALGIIALLAVVSGVVGALTFPTDTLVRAGLARVPLPAGMRIDFANARLRPNGLYLDDVHVVRPGGRPAFDAQWIRLWPSLLGLWRDHTGRPWSIGAATCQGTIDVDVGAGERGTPITVALGHVEVASCLPYVLPQVNAYGRLDGRLSVVVGGPDRPVSEGALDVRGAAWKPGGPLEDAPLRADAGTVTWRLAGGRLDLTSLEASSSDFHASGTGFLRVLTSTDDSVLDVRLAVTPGRTMPVLLRRYFDAVAGDPPDARGTRTFRIQGTLRDPRVVASGRLP